MLSRLFPTLGSSLPSLRRRLPPSPPHSSPATTAVLVRQVERPPGSDRTRLTARQRHVFVAGFAFGLAVSLLMVARSQVGGDQLNLLARGWLLAFEGRWVPFGNPTSTGGLAPGGLTAVLTGLPLLLWQHHRAASLLVWSGHLLAFLLLDRSLRDLLSGRERLLLLLLYWLAPWRIYFSGFLWNPNHLFLLGAVHTWTALRQRQRPSRGHSFLHVVAIGLAAQLHASALILALSSALLVHRRLLRLHWPGAFAGALLVGGSLLQWLLALPRHAPALLGDDAFLGRGLLLGYPLLRALLYWLRYPSSWISSDMRCFDLTPFLGDGGGEAAVVRAMQILLLVVGAPVAAAALYANLRMWKRPRSPRSPRPGVPASARAWLLAYCRATFVAVVVVFALSPTTTSMWQLLIVYHVSILPLLLSVGAVLRARRRRAVGLAVGAYAMLCALLICMMALGSPHYRCGGRSCDGLNASTPVLRGDHVMFDQLGIHDSCPLSVGAPGGWWPDVLGESERLGRR